MSEATTARTPDHTDARHLELVEYEVSRHRQNSLRIRMGTLALVAGYIALHAAHAQPRYMFVAPVIAIGGWILDAHAEWNVRALRLLGRALRGEIRPRPAVLSLDTASWADHVSWRSVLLRPARALWFHPLVAIASFIAVDAPKLDTEGFPSELFCYLAVTFGTFLGLVVVAWSWWYDHFAGDPVTTIAAFPTAAPPIAAPPALNAPSPLRSVDGPFPSKPQRSESTNPFGTAVG